jgi:hypothetical protein
MTKPAACIRQRDGCQRVPDGCLEGFTGTGLGGAQEL